MPIVPIHIKHTHSMPYLLLGFLGVFNMNGGRDKSNPFPSLPSFQNFPWCPQEMNRLNRLNRLNRSKKGPKPFYSRSSILNVRSIGRCNSRRRRISALALRVLRLCTLRLDGGRFGAGSGTVRRGKFHGGWKIMGKSMMNID